MLRIYPDNRATRNERGVVLIVALIVATIFAVLAYIVLAVSIHSLDTTDSARNSFTSRQIAEGAVNEGAYRLLVNKGTDGLEPTYKDPSWALSATESDLKAGLLQTGNSTLTTLDSFPPINQRTMYTSTDGVSTYSPDSEVVSGDKDKAKYTYLSDDTFSQDYPAFEFNPVQTSGNMSVYGVGQATNPTGDPSMFSFVRGDYPNIEVNYQEREAGVTEPSRLGPYPLIESEHPYGDNESRGWAVTYQNDPAHSGRHLTGLRLLANTNEVQIDNGDQLMIAGWLDTEKRFQNLGEILPGNILTNYINNATQVFTQALPTTTIGLFLQTDATPPTPGMDFGFRVNGVRYDFDSDQFPVYYETPHPYDQLIDTTDAGNLNLQVIYSPYQAAPGDPGFFTQQMQIDFDNQFSLDSGDRLYLFNASDSLSPAPIAIYSDLVPPVPGGVPPIVRSDPALPLGYVLILYRASPGDHDGTPNYGYKVNLMQYTDAQGTLQAMSDPTMQSPHSTFLGPNEKPYSLPAVMPFPTPIGQSLAGYQTIYKPAVPDKDDPSGLGTVSDWSVGFTDSCNLTATSAAANSDRIRITTPGNLLVGAFDTVYFVSPYGGYGPLIGVDPQYFSIEDMKNGIGCGLADKMEIEFTSDNVDSYESSLQNYGFYAASVAYTTAKGTDDDLTPPTIRSDVNYPKNTSYPAFGNGPLESPEWWYSNSTALVVGLHFDRYNFNLDPGDRLEIYDNTGVLIATLISDSVSGGPSGGGPNNPNNPTGGPQPGHSPGGGGPSITGGGITVGSVVDLNATYGWVLVPGNTAQVKLIGDSSDNQGYSGFEIDHCAFVNGDLTEIQSYANEYQSVAYDKYYDRTADPLNRFRALGVE